MADKAARRRSVLAQVVQAVIQPPRSPETEPSELDAALAWLREMYQSRQRGWDGSDVVSLARLLSERDRSAREAGFREGIEAAAEMIATHSVVYGADGPRVEPSRHTGTVARDLAAAVRALPLPTPEKGNEP